MASAWTGRIVAGTAAALAVACGGSLDSTAPGGATARADEPPAPKPPISLVNTGKKPEAGFLLDLSKPDEGRQYLADYSMDADWIKIVYRPGNIEFGKTGMTLNLLKTRGEKLPFSGSEFQRTGFYGYGRYEAVLTATDDQGAVSSFFTYTGEQFGDPHDEIDFEFLGRSPHVVYLNYFRGGEEDQVAIPLGFDASRGDHLYAFEWSPQSIRWIVDGKVIREVAADSSKNGLPRASGKVIANLWAGAGAATGWTGDPNFSHATANYRCISHVPMGQTGPQCSDTFTPPAQP